MTIPTPHINAKKNDFAKTVLMPGDPLRSKFIAETFLEDTVLINNVRGIQGYSGTYKGKRVSVMASGMGMPSIGIYSYELYNFYDVSSIIRIGSCGAINSKLNLYDIIIGIGSCTNSNYADQFDLPGNYAPIASYDLVKAADEASKKLGYDNVYFGNLLSSDTFYDDSLSLAKWQKMNNVLGVEMESAALYMNAARTNKKALAICTVSDKPFENEATTAQERQTSFTKMMELALEIAE